ncbi:SMP-30/gluconolactonase/LRE family protein [Mesorhizobium sp. ES1-1]|uniref:SMP-30/gluconolactonase/LRE family protein n=1 Tax=Mesorhizobium sp. ES1-1 TaxID=2876629 RepID=UPI001CCA648F|nr:SMP-30/gluconolactonase/LRE family protein [Mesorhizobium sp. ES1-1]MBZ9676326.1 SMP-30/gluconolactonase/LRE family protein [Mesorhizobium sp. ES1-1]
MGLGAFVRGLFTSGDAGISVPAMDGIFKPNNRLEEAERLLSLPTIDNLAATSGGLLCSAGPRLLRIDTNGASVAAVEIAAFSAPITFVASAPDGRLAVGVEGDGLHVGQPGGWQRVDLQGANRSCLTAGAFAPDGTLFVCVGSRDHPARDWKRDLMEGGASGVLVAVGATDGSSRVIASGLAFPNGVALLGDGRLAVSESWRHRIVALDPKSASRPVAMLEDLPAYPSRLSPASGGGLWMALFAPRRQLFELVLREHDYRREMMATIDPDEWIGPELAGSARPDQPLSQGSVRQMGVLKPWAPSRSYGLVARCDENGVPRESWHSRADGAMHGITSVWEHGGDVYATSRGSGTLLRLAATNDGGSAHG